MSVPSSNQQDAEITRDTPFTVKQRQRLVSQTGYGHRPVNDWGGGDLPAPFAEGDLVLFRGDTENDRLRGMGPGYFVVSCAFSIDEGDAWYFRVRNNRDHGSDRLHVAFAARCTWGEDCDWMAGFDLIETADPDGLAAREAMLAAGWTMPPSPLNEVNELRAERDALRAQLQAVKDLHRACDCTEHGIGGSSHCLEDGFFWPCPTFRAASAPGVGAAQTRTEET